jgi:hypothetical protein
MTSHDSSNKPSARRASSRRDSPRARPRVGRRQQHDQEQREFLPAHCKRSPEMEMFAPCELGEAGKPHLPAGEVELCIVDRASIRPADKSSSAPSASLASGVLYVTTHGIFWVSPCRTSAFHTELRNLAAPRDKFHPWRAGFVLPHLVGAGVLMRFTSKKSKDRALASIIDAQRRVAWNVPPPSLAEKVDPRQKLPRDVAARTVAPQQLPACDAGFSRAIRVERQVADERGKEITHGFASLTALDRRADALVNIAARFRTLNADPRANEQHHKVFNICIASPVTRDAAGNDVGLYRVELARELSRHLRPPVVEVGGIMTVADAYCLINRVRATNEYVSPDDFVAALSLFGQINSRLTVFRLDSGVRALRVDMASEPGGIDKVAAMAEQGGRTSISAVEVMQMRTIPVQAALDLLETAERAGLLARDETTDGVRFFRNNFAALLTAAEASSAAAADIAGLPAKAHA